MRKKKEFNIPEAFLTQLNEYSNGGFIIFTFDSEGGLVINSQFDTQHHSTSMHYSISQWAEAINNLNLLSTTHLLAQCNRKKN